MRGTTILPSNSQNTECAPSSSEKAEVISGSCGTLKS